MARARTHTHTHTLFLLLSLSMRRTAIKWRAGGGGSGLLLTLEPALKETWPNTEIRPNNYLFDAAVKRRTVLVVMLRQGVRRGRKVMVFDTMENHGQPRQSDCSAMWAAPTAPQFQVRRPAIRATFWILIRPYIFNSNPEGAINLQNLIRTFRVLRAATRCSLVGIYQSFVGRYRLHLQGWL